MPRACRCRIRQQLLDFHRRTAELNRAIEGALGVADEATERLRHLRQAAIDTPGGDASWVDRIDALHESLADLEIELTGDRTIERRSEPDARLDRRRARRAMSGWTTTAAPTGTHRRQYEIAAEAFAPVLARLRELVDTELAGLEAEMEAEGAPWTPGRLPLWQAQ